MVNNTFALQSYKFFSAVGDGCFAAAVDSFATSMADRQFSTPFLAAGALTKIISMIPFYSEPEVGNIQPHPLSGISYPGFAGLVSANIAAIAGNTFASKFASKVVSLVAGASLNYFNQTIVYHTPSTLMHANAPTCNVSEYANATSYANATVGDERCYLGQKTLVNQSSALYTSLLVTMCVDVMSFMQMGAIYAKPISSQIQSPDGNFISILKRIKFVAQSAILMSPIVTHLIAMRLSSGYRSFSILSHQLPLASAPYLVAIMIHKLFRGDHPVGAAFACVFGLVKMFNIILYQMDTDATWNFYINLFGWISIVISMFPQLFFDDRR